MPSGAQATAFATRYTPTNSSGEITMYRGSAMTAGVFIAGLALLGLSHEAAGQPGGMTVLTDGTTLNAFDQVGNANWRIAERTIAADLGNGFLVTKQSYGDFRLRAEFWVDEIANSGIFIRCDDPEEPGANSCYEVNIFDTRPDPAYGTGAIVNVAKVDPMPRTALKWNVIEIEARGPQLNVSINGDRTVSVRDTKHARGRIALQYGAGVVRFHKVEIQPLTDADLVESPGMYANCQYGFAIIFPGQPMARDIRYTATGTDVPAHQFYIEQGQSRYSVTVVDFPNGPRADDRIVDQAVAELSKRGEVRYRAFGDYDPGMPGRQLNIFEPNGRQLRASVYMANRRMTITEASAPVGDFNALQFEQSISLLDHTGTDIDRVNAGNEEPRKYDCR
jgi:hypothetical protein